MVFEGVALGKYSKERLVICSPCRYLLEGTAEEEQNEGRMGLRYTIVDRSLIRRGWIGWIIGRDGKRGKEEGRKGRVRKVRIPK
jgi:hypothetical protein